VDQAFGFTKGISMRMELLTGMQLWETLCADPDFFDIPAEDHAVWLEFCEDVASTTWTWPMIALSAESFGQARHEIVHFMLERDWLDRLPGLKIRDNIKTSMFIANSMDSDTLEGVTEFFDTFDALLASFDMTPEDYLTSNIGGRFRPETLTCWREGNMSMQDLLLMQPSALFRND
jgi:hypothetical protein